MDKLKKIVKDKRNGKLFDKWSIVHIASSASLTLLFGPLAAFVITLIWEPVEVLILSPKLKKFGVTFGYETLVNSISDIFFNCIGIALILMLFS